MKKIYVFATLLFLILSLVIPVSANTAEAPLMVDLIAGQNQHAGDIKVWDDGTSLFVSYETVSPWCLTETHLAVVSSLDSIPQANGNPIPGQFPYKNTHNCATNFLYTIPLTKGACQIYIAAHAAVKSPESTETAWGNGLDFPGNNWGTYFLYEPNICKVTSTLTESATLSNTPTNMPTSTATNTPTGTPPTNTPTTISTDTPTGTLPTNTPTNTSTNTSTGTPPTNTSTSTSTNTPTTCQPTVVNADFSNIALGQSVEGMGVAAPNLNIDAKGTAIKIAEGASPVVYGAPNTSSFIPNGGLSPNGGFSDLVTKTAQQAHQYTFTFAPGTSVTKFSLHMLDFGDLNPSNSLNHLSTFTAYDANNNVVSQSELSYTADLNLQSPQYGNLNITGDAKTALPGQPGNWTWNVTGTSITKVILQFNIGFDPNIAFDTLSFTTRCP